MVVLQNDDVICVAFVCCECELVVILCLLMCCVVNL